MFVDMSGSSKAQAPLTTNGGIAPSGIGEFETISAAIDIALLPLPERGELEREWRNLQARAHGSFFTSWTWIAAWLDVFGQQPQTPAALQLMRATLHGQVVGLGIVCAVPTKRILGQEALAAYLHQTGLPDDNRAFIEYNGFLVDRDHGRAVWAALLTKVAARFADTHTNTGWATFQIAGADAAAFTAVAESDVPYRVLVQHRCHWVNLTELNEGVEAYMQHLSANSRTQVRRSIKLFEAGGSGLAVRIAAHRAEAHAYLEELKALHIETWQRRKNNAGAFSAPSFPDFAAKLIEFGYDTGNVDLVRVAAGSETVGMLLNFIHDGHVYAYQSGFAYSADNRLKPGLVTHALAIAHYKNMGLRGYHFMAGEGRYKSSLSNAVETLTWVSLYRDDFQAKLENALKTVKRQLLSA